MDGGDDPGTGQEGAEDGEGERRDRQREVPHPHQAPAFLDEDRVQVGRPAEPRQQGRILHRVPAPETTPAEHLVRPPGTQHDAHGEEGERHQGPAPALDLPAVPHPARGQHPDGEGEGHGEDDEADVEERRVDRHQRVVLEERIRSEPLRHAGGGDEGVGRTDHEAEEEGGDDVEDERGVADDRIVREAAVAPHEDGRDDREYEAPQQDGPRQRGPHARDRVQQRRDRAVVLGHEHQREVVRHERVLHRTGGKEHPDEHYGRQQAGVTRRARRRRRQLAGDVAAGDQPEDGDDDPHQARHEGEPHPDGPQMRVEHQQTGPLDVTFTRPGYCAL